MATTSQDIPTLRLDTDNPYVLSMGDGECDLTRVREGAGEVAAAFLREVDRLIGMGAIKDRDKEELAGLVGGKLALKAEIADHVVNSSRRAVTLYDVEGRLAFANRGHAELMGVDAKDLKRLWDYNKEAYLRFLYAPESAQDAQERLEGLQMGTHDAYRWAGLRADDRTVVHSTTIQYDEDPDRTGLFERSPGSLRIMRDVTDAAHAWAAREGRPATEFRIPEGRFFKGEEGRGEGDRLSQHAIMRDVRRHLRANVPDLPGDLETSLRHLAQALAMGALAWEKGPMLMYVLDAFGNVALANAAFCRHFGVGADGARKLSREGRLAATLARTRQDAMALLDSACPGRDFAGTRPVVWQAVGAPFRAQDGTWRRDAFALERETFPLSGGQVLHIDDPVPGSHGEVGA